VRTSSLRRVNIGVSPEDIEHAIRRALVVEEVGEDPVRYLVLGPDRTGNIIEVVVLDRRGRRRSTPLAMRPQYRRLLEEHRPR
jgi:hypothetical protein